MAKGLESGEGDPQVSQESCWMCKDGECGMASLEAFADLVATTGGGT